MNDTVRINWRNGYLDVKIDDASVRYRSLMGENNVTLRYQLPEHQEIPLGATIVYENETYTLNSPASFKKNAPDNYDYTLVFEAAQYQLKGYQLYNPIDRRLKFSYTARPIEFLNLLVANLNERDSGWAVGQSIGGNETVISFNHVSCWDALQMIADAFETEWEVVNKIIYLHKVQYNLNNPLPLSYGKDNGFKPGLGRINYTNGRAINTVFADGGTRNINPTTYGSQYLHMLRNYQIGFDGIRFSNQAGYDQERGRMYVTDNYGYAVYSQTPPVRTNAEGSVDLTNVYPERVGTVSDVMPVGQFWDFFDDSIPLALDYSQCRIPGERATVIFQSGMLAGKEFDIMQTEDALTGYDHAQRRFSLVSREIDGQIMPNGSTGYVMKPGDRYIVFHIALPQQYIDEAELIMTQRAVKYLHDNENPKFTFSGELDGIWASQRWNQIVSYIRLGGYINFSDNQFQLNPVPIRITAIRDYLVRPHYPVIDLSNNPISGTLHSVINKIESEEVDRENAVDLANSLTKRSYQGARELIGLLEGAIEGFSEGINPVTVQTMQILLGSENLQFAYVQSSQNPVVIPPRNVFNLVNNTFTVNGGTVRHMINSRIIAPENEEGYVFYNTGAYYRRFLPAEDKIPYYVYLEAQGTTATITLSTTSLPFESGIQGKYNLLVGIISSVLGGNREFAPLYGFTEILPGQITTDLIRSADGNCYFDLVGNAIRAGGTSRALEWNIDGQGRLDLVNADIGITNSEGVKTVEINGDDGSGFLASSNLAWDQIGNLTVTGRIQSAETGQRFVLDPAGSWTFYDPSNAIIGRWRAEQYQNGIYSQIDTTYTNNNVVRNASVSGANGLTCNRNDYGSTLVTSRYGADELAFNRLTAGTSPTIEEICSLGINETNGTLFVMKNLPTSASGLASGQVYRNGSTLMIVP